MTDQGAHHRRIGVWNVIIRATKGEDLRDIKLLRQIEKKVHKEIPAKMGLDSLEKDEILRIKIL